MELHKNVRPIVAARMLAVLGISNRLFDTNTPDNPDSWQNAIPGAMTVYTLLSEPVVCKCPFEHSTGNVTITYSTGIRNEVEDALAEAEEEVQALLSK